MVGSCEQSKLENQWEIGLMKGKHQNFNVDYRERSIARIDNLETGHSFAVLCYGFSHSNLCTVGGEDGGGQQLERKLAIRGINTDKWRGNIFNTAAVKDNYNDL
jgi:hypothetical protein